MTNDIKAALAVGALLLLFGVALVMAWQLVP